MNKKITNTSIIQIKGKAVPIPGDDIDTDQLMPARFLKEITFDHMGEYLFYDLRFDGNGKSIGYIIDASQYKGAKILIVGNNFGCGSSREHAPQAIKRFGIEAIIGASFAEIFSGNCKSLGIPLLTASAADLVMLRQIAQKEPASEFNCDLISKTISVNKQTFSIDLPEVRRESFINGTWDAVALLKQNLDKIEAIKLPY